nr:conserved hypothetical protein [Albugo laibachii Nc14]|eukprot:CCA17386.1 conserved hypothetical protein [Albugo laibachii Nc14]
MELWTLIRSIFVTLSIEVIEMRPHVSDGEMILTKWRVQGEIASANQLNSISVSSKYAAALKIALLAIKSSDLTFTVTTFIIFDEYKIAQQYHCWDQVSVFKRLFGGNMPSAILNILTIV